MPNIFLIRINPHALNAYMIMDLTFDTLPAFLDSFKADLTPLNRDVMFGFVLARAGFPHTAREICKRHSLTYSHWDDVILEAYKALRLAMAAHKINKYDDIPLPQPRHKQNQYVHVQVDSGVWDDGLRPDALDIALPLEELAATATA